MAFFSATRGMPAHTSADPQSQAEQMERMQRLHNMQVASEAARVKRLREEEARRQEMEAVEMDQLPENKAVQVAPTTTFDDYATGGAFTTAPTPAPAPNLAPRTALERDFAAKNQTPAGPDQSAAESARLAGKPTPGEAAAARMGLKDRSRELQRLKELQRKNPTGPSSAAKARPATGELQSPAETQRLIEKNRAAAQGQGQAQAQAPATPPNFEALAAAVKQVESGGDPSAVSPKGAVGTMQTMPGTLRDPGFGVTPAKDNSPAEQERVGRDYLQAMIAKYGNIEHALVAYNWGPTNADKWIAAGADPAALPKETREYVPKVLSQLGGTQMQKTSAPVQEEAPVDGAMAPAPTQVAASAQGGTPRQVATMFSPEYINNTAAQTSEELRLAQIKLAEINRRLSYAPDLATAQKLRDAANEVRFGAQNALYRNAAVRAATGDENSMAQLASAAGVQYAQTDAGYVQAVLDPTSGQYSAASEPMSREAFINNLYSVATGAAAKQAQLINAQRIKTQGEMQVAAQKFGNDLRMEQLKGQQALQKLIVENRLKPSENKITISSFDGKAYVTNNNGVFMVEPGRDIGNGVVSEPRLVPVDAGQVPTY